MDRFASLTLVALLCCSGCGRSETSATSQTPQNLAAPAPTNALATSTATDVVSQFLDEIRRGGQDSSAHLLLTQKAQSELKRIGRTVQPIGSPDARFQVTRAEAVPDELNTALVHSVWSETGEDGQPIDFQVVWAVQQESGSWRISGLVMELDEAQPPMIIDFENGEMMARLLAAPTVQSPSTPSANSSSAPANHEAMQAQAAAADPNLSR
jgi:hypothetical protein